MDAIIDFDKSSNYALEELEDAQKSVDELCSQTEGQWKAANFANVKISEAIKAVKEARFILKDAIDSANEQIDNYADMADAASY